ncbi:MAG: hemolysin family protein [Phycisphaerae bacterium]
MIATFAILAAADLSWLNVTFHVALLLFLVVLSGTFSGSETVLFALTPAQLQHQAASSNPFRRLAARLMKQPKRTLTTILVGNTAVNVLLFATSYVLFRNLVAQAGVWITPMAGVASVLLVVVGGEVVPKVLGVTLAPRLAPFSATVVHFSGYVLGPLGRLLDIVVVEPLTRLIFGRPGHGVSTESELTSAELKTLLVMSRRRGLINRIEDAYLREVINLSEIRARDVMVPRVEVQMFDVNGPPEELRDLMRTTHLTKIPVYDGAIDNVVGLVYAKVLFFEPDKPLRDLVTPVRFVPELITGEQLLKHFRKTKSQIAIAVDEFGGMAGLVTLEDVLEEIVGEIHDPEDEQAEPEIVQLSETEYEISGRLSVLYWVETFGIGGLTDRVATVAGLVTARLGRPAQVGESIRIGNVELGVIAVSGRRIQRLRLTLLGKSAADSGGVSS